MADSNAGVAATAATGAAAKKHLAVYATIERNERTHWLKIGAAFANRDGSTTVLLDALPIGTNRLLIREPRAWEEARPPNGQPAQPSLIAEAQP